jgi:hypothetical protein
MSILLPALGVAFAAFCVWLSVRIFNRRERWAKWAGRLFAGLSILYVVSFGPASWFVSWTGTGNRFVSIAYHPFIRILADGPLPISRMLHIWANVGVNQKVGHEACGCVTLTGEYEFGIFDPLNRGIIPPRTGYVEPQ